MATTSMANDHEQQDEPPCHIPDCTLPVDVVIKTSDGKYFGTHLQNLENYAEGFPPKSLGKRKRVNNLDIEETSDVTSLMLHLMHKQPQPNLEEVSAPVLVGLAEAVAKYMIYSAMNTCRLVMRNRASEAGIDILAYALKHGYRDVADAAAPHTLGEALKEVRKQLGPTGMAAWAEYREGFLSIFRNHGLADLDFHPEDWVPGVCAEHDCRVSILRELSTSPVRILEETWKEEQISVIQTTSGCNECREGLQVWLRGMFHKAKLLPPLSSLLD